MRISKLPVEIQTLVFIRQKEQGDSRINNTLRLSQSKENGNFNWDETKEGHIFWSNIDKGKYEHFYKMYPTLASIKCSSTLKNGGIYLANTKEEAEAFIKEANSQGYKFDYSPDGETHWDKYSPICYHLKEKCITHSSFSWAKKTYGHKEIIPISSIYSSISIYGSMPKEASKTDEIINDNIKTLLNLTNKQNEQKGSKSNEVSRQDTKRIRRDIVGTAAISSGRQQASTGSRFKGNPTSTKIGAKKIRRVKISATVVRREYY